MSFPPVTELVPHSRLMCLLDRVLSHEDGETACSARIEEGNLFLDSCEQVPAWVGIEYMAQCIAVHGGLLDHAAGNPIRRGLFLGSRKIEVRNQCFEVGSEFVVTARHLRGRESGMQAFSCTLRSHLAATPWLEGTLNVRLLEPDSGEAREPQGVEA